MAGSATRPSNQSTNKSKKNNNNHNVLMRKKFWDTVLNKPHPEQLLLNTSPISKSCQPAPNCTTSSSSSSTYRPPHKPSYGERHANTHRQVDTWQKARKPRPFKCSICQSCYAQKGDMVRHIRCVHEGLRPFQCDVCGNAFGRRSVLNKHMKRHWKNSAVNQYALNIDNRGC